MAREPIHTAFERSQEAMVCLDDAGSVCLANRAARELLGDATSLRLVETARGPRPIRADGRLVGYEVERMATASGELVVLRPPTSRQSRALEQLFDAVLSQPERFEILRMLVEIVGAALAVDRAVVYEVDLASGEATWLSEWTSRDAAASNSLGAARPVGALTERARALLTSRRWLEGHASAPAPLLVSDGDAGAPRAGSDRRPRSYVAYPLAFGPTTHLVLSLEQVAHERAWMPGEVDFIRAATRIVDLALRNRWLVESSSRAENALMDLQRLQSIRVLTGGAAHDLASYMGAIHWAVERARSLVPSTDPLVASLDDIASASRSCIDLVRQLLTYARKGQQAIQAVALGPLAEDLHGLLQSIASNAVRLEVDDRAPVEGDPNQLRQVIVNLVSNAAEASAEHRSTKGISLRVGRRAHADGTASATITVRDWGSGIPTEMRERVFEPFFGIKGAGRGLGLAAVARIVREYGGTVRLESEVGEGTTVTVALPLSDDSEPPSP